MSEVEYSQGVCHDGAAILKDGVPMTIEQILGALRSGQASCSESPNSSDHIADASKMVSSAQGDAEPVPFVLGNVYQTLEGGQVRFVKVHNEGISYETMEDEDGVNRYTRRDFGRVTASPVDYPKNVAPLYTRPPSAGVPEPDMFWDAENPEYGGGEIDTVIEDMADNMNLNTSEVFEVMRAKKLPNRQILVKVDADGNSDWEWHTPEPPKQEGA